MKKRLLTTMLILSTSASIIACGSSDTSTAAQDSEILDAQKEESTISTRPVSAYDNSNLETIISGIETDFNDTIQYLQTSLDETNTTIGETYESYIENKHVLTDWYNLVISEETALFERTKERTIEYFKLISSSIDHNDEDAIDNAMEEYYDTIYDGVMEDFYDDVYDDMMEDVYDTYYDGIVEDGYDVDPYEKWNDESNEAYETWSDTSSAVYDEWSNTHSTLYQYWSAVNSGFYTDNFDIDAMIESSEKEETEEENTSDDSDSESQEGIRPEFQEAMDSYEAFFDEYAAFMNEYASADTDAMLDLMDDYTDYMTQYVETMENFEALDTEELSTEESLYYAEVSARISAKLLEIQY